MELSTYIDIYCERVAPGLFNEPLNLISNLAFLISAAAVWKMTGDRRPPMVTALITTLAMIGIGSGLFHSFATAWASIADVLPIALFVLLYVFAATRDFLRLCAIGAWGAVILTLPWTWLVGMGVAKVLPLYASSSVYVAILLLIALYALIALVAGERKVAGGLLIGSFLLGVSITFRAYDIPVCDALPIGVHYMWHLLNAIVLGWMIMVYHWRMLGDRPETRNQSGD